MNINYTKIDDELNRYAIETIYDIMEKCGKLMTQEQFEIFENCILKSRIVIIDKPNEKDNELFKGNVPVAHGPRAKKDGYIHVYPYKYKNLDTEQIIDNYINGSVILHELYHYLIRLDVNSSNDKMRIKFGHYITEGMVEYFTELHNNHKVTKWSARRNVDMAEKLYETLLNKKNIKMLFHSNFEEIFNKYPELEILFEEYKKECAFIEGLISILDNIKDKITIDTKNILSRFNRLSLLQGIEDLKIESENYLDKEDSTDFNKQIDELYSNIYEKKEKRLSN